MTAIENIRRDLTSMERLDVSVYVGEFCMHASPNNIGKWKVVCKKRNLIDGICVMNTHELELAIDDVLTINNVEHYERVPKFDKSGYYIGSTYRAVLPKITHNPKEKAIRKRLGAFLRLKHI